MMLFSKQKSKISRVSCVPKPSHIITRRFWLARSLVWGFKHKLKPLQADLGVGVSTVGVRIMLSRSGVRAPVGSMAGSWPDYKGIKTPTVRTYVLDGSHCRSLNTRASIASLVVLTDKNFDRVELGEHDASLVHYYRHSPP